MLAVLRRRGALVCFGDAGVGGVGAVGGGLGGLVGVLCRGIAGSCVGLGLGGLGRPGGGEVGHFGLEVLDGRK